MNPWRIYPLAILNHQYNIVILINAFRHLYAMIVEKKSFWATKASVYFLKTLISQNKEFGYLYAYISAMLPLLQDSEVWQYRKVQNCKSRIQLIRGYRFLHQFSSVQKKISGMQILDSVHPRIQIGTATQFSTKGKFQKWRYKFYSNEEHNNYSSADKRGTPEILLSLPDQQCCLKMS